MRKHWLHLLLGLAVVVAALGLGRVRMGTDILAVLPAEMPERQGLEAFQRAMARERELIVLLSGDAAELADQARELCAELEASPAVAGAFWRPRWREDPDAIAELLLWLWLNGPPEEVEAQVERLRRGESQKVWTEAIERIATRIDGSSLVAAAHDPLGFLDHPAARALFELAEQGGGVGGGGAEDGGFASPDGRHHLILVESARELDGYREAGEWLGEVRALVDPWAAARGVGVAMTGEPAFEAEIGRSTERDMRGTVGITSVAIGVLFLLMQRRAGLLAGLGLVLVLTFAVAAGLAGWIYGELSIMAAGFAAILIGLVVDYGVLICQEGKLAGHKVGAMRRATTRSILWAALTTATVFLALNGSGLPGIAQLGTIVACGVLAGAVLMLAVYVPLVARAGRGRPPVAHKRSWIPPRGRAWAAVGLAMAAAVAVIALRGFPGVEFDSRMLRPRNSAAMSAYDRIQECFPGWGIAQLRVVVEADSVAAMRARLDEAERLLGRLREEHPGLVLGYSLPRGWWGDPGRQERNLPVLAELGQMLPRLVAEGREAGFSEQGLALDRRIIELVPRWSEISTGGFPENPAVLEMARTLVHPEGGGRGQVMGSIELADEENLSPADLEVLRRLSGDGIHLGGWSLIKPAVVPLVMQDVTRVFLPMLGVMVVMLSLVFRRAREVLASLGALALTGLVLLAAMRVIGMEWNFLNIAATPLLLGTTLDYSIHILLAVQRARGDRRQVWNGTGKAVLFCGGSTAIGFGSLALASNPALASLGVVTVIGILSAALIAVFILPAVAAPASADPGPNGTGGDRSGPEGIEGLPSSRDLPSSL